MFWSVPIHQKRESRPSASDYYDKLHLSDPIYTKQTILPASKLSVLAYKPHCYGGKMEVLLAPSMSMMQNGNSKPSLPMPASCLIAGHLLNMELGGTGDSFNIVPLTSSANSRHSIYENAIKQLLNDMYNKDSALRVSNYELWKKTLVIGLNYIVEVKGVFDCAIQITDPTSPVYEKHIYVPDGINLKLEFKECGRGTASISSISGTPLSVSLASTPSTDDEAKLKNDILEIQRTKYDNLNPLFGCHGLYIKNDSDAVNPFFYFPAL